MKQWFVEKLKKFSVGEFGRVFFCLLVGLVVLKAVGILFLLQFDNNLFFADISKIVLIDLVNEERKASGVGELTENHLLSQAAFLKAQDMLKNGYFSHNSPLGVAPWYWFTRAGYNYQFAGENLGVGFLDSQELHQAWNDSVSHKANLLSPNYQEVGIAVVKGNFQGNPDTTVVVQLFGTPRKAPLKLATTQAMAEIASKKFTTGQADNVPAKVVGESVKGEAIAAKRPKDASGPIAGMRLGFFRFMAEKYDLWLSGISFAALLFTLFYLGYAALHNFRPAKIDILAACLCLVFALTLLDKSLILKIIPHYSVIY